MTRDFELPTVEAVIGSPPPPPPTDDPARAAAALGVVEALYAFAEEPARWDDVIAAVNALPSPLDPAHDKIAASIVGHAARAAAMIERLNAGRDLTDRATAAWDAVLLTSENRVRKIVGHAASRLEPYLAKPLVDGERLALDKAAAQGIDAALAAAREAGSASLAPFTLVTADDTARCFGIALPREAFPDTLATSFALGAVWAEPLFALVLLSSKDGAATGEHAPRRLGLTAAEARLAAKLVQGLQLSECAASLGISTHTARTQLKNIFAKTGTKRQSELLRLLTNAASFPQPTSSSDAMTMPDTPPRRFVTLADGRHLYYREYGIESGPAVVYFHVGLAASLVMPEIARAAVKSGLRLIAFERPGFGQSSPRRDYTFETIADDVEQLLQRLNIASVALFGDGYGGAFAVAAARKLNGAIRRLALRSPHLGRSLANDQRSMLSALFRQSWIIPGVAELMHRGIRVSLVRSLMRHYAERSSTDAARAAEPEFQHFFDAVIFDALERTGAGLSAELSLFASGARADPASLTCPISIWHGAEHPGIPAGESIATFTGHKNAALHILPGIGSYLTQPVFDDIFAWLAAPQPPYPT
ncbi:MAG: alpha/beta fold hydrolase [Alphaproteobacteria bacterium]|nr:alpha/beta fold hydrolase [Alphaproteobacteria bacterium]